MWPSTQEYHYLQYSEDGETSQSSQRNSYKKVSIPIDEMLRRFRTLHVSSRCRHDQLVLVPLCAWVYTNRDADINNTEFLLRASPSCAAHGASQKHKYLNKSPVQVREGWLVVEKRSLKSQKGIQSIGYGSSYNIHSCIHTLSIFLIMQRLSDVEHHPTATHTM